MVFKMWSPDKHRVITDARDLGMHILRPHPRRTESEALGGAQHTVL